MVIELDNQDVHGDGIPVEHVIQMIRKMTHNRRYYVHD